MPPASPTAPRTDPTPTAVTSDGTPVAQPLTGLRVLECGDTIASAYAGRLFADLGADVVLVEDLGGHPLRHVGPFLAGVPGRERSGGFAAFAASKRSVVVDVASAASTTTLTALATAADVLIRSTEDGRDWLDDAALAAVRITNPGLIVVDVSCFGRIGRDGEDRHPNSDLLALAAGGLLSLNATVHGGEHATPLRYRGELSSIHAAGDAVVAALGALFERRRSGLGQRIDVSAQAAVASILATAVATYAYTGDVAVHDGRRGVAPWAFYPCRDGIVLVQITEDSQWHAFVELLGSPEWGTLEVFATNTLRIESMDLLDPLVSELTAGFTTAELLEACHAKGVAAALIHTAADLLQWEHLAARGFFETVPVHDRGTVTAVTVPGTPWRFHRTGRVRRGAPPRLGEHDDRAVTDWTTSPPVQSVTAEPHRAEATSSPVPPPLAGVRVVDFTWVWAGPYASMQLAHLGAEVVKIESSERLDVTRLLGPWADQQPGKDRSGYFNQYNLGKQSVVLDVRHPDGLALLRRMLATADVVIDNRRAGTLARMGFSYEELRALNPRIVAVAMTGFGEDGPERDRMAYGSIIDALSGVASANGAVAGGPTDFPMSLPDPCAGIHAAIATLAALHRARETGHGERVECSMLEASVAAFPWPVLYQGVEGRPAPVIGNRDDRRAPHDVYRCQGHYEWVALYAGDDDDFARLAEAIGRADLASHPRFATAAARGIHADELDAIIGAWTAPRTPDEAAAALRAAGVPAERVAQIPHLFTDGALRSRGFFVAHEHPAVGVRELPGPAWVTERSPMVAAIAAPCHGAHSRSVLQRWLAVTDDELDRLGAAGVIGPPG